VGGHSALAVVEAAYRIERPTGVWLEHVVRAAHPLLDGGLGVAGFTYRLAGGQIRLTSEIVTVGDVPVGSVELIGSVTEQWEREQAGWVLEQAFDTASEVFARHDVSDRPPAFYRPVPGSRDALAAKGVDPSGRGVVLTAPLQHEHRTTAGERRRWSRVMAHVLAGLRLRDELRGRACEAVIDPRGRVVHAEGPAQGARWALRDAAVTLDRMRARSATDEPDASLAVWQGLVRGRWSIIDRFDRDGRRFLVARRNDPPTAGPAVLSERVRQVLAYAGLGLSNKQIAYTLGLAPSTVSTHLRAGMRTLGIADRAALAEVFAPRSRCPAPGSKRAGAGGDEAR
jgi:DNA-binding CsgD family transcriptional regulator